MFFSLAALNSALSQTLTCMFKLIQSVYPLSLGIHFLSRLTGLCVATMLLCVTLLPVTIEFQGEERLLPDIKENSVVMIEVVGKQSQLISCFLFSSAKENMSGMTAFCLFVFSSTSPSICPSLVLARNPDVNLSDWETHLSSDVIVWFIILPLQFTNMKSWLWMMTESCPSKNQYKEQNHKVDLPYNTFYIYLLFFLPVVEHAECE